MSETTLQSLISSENIGLVIKIFQILVIILFIIYAFLTIRQIGVMNKALTNPLHFELVVLAYFQFFLGVGLLLIIVLR